MDWIEAGMSHSTSGESSWMVHPLTSDTPLSKSRFVGGCQCPLRLWLEVRTDAPRTPIDASAQARFDTGDEVGELARLRWDAREIAAGRVAGTRIVDDPLRFREGLILTREAIESGARIIHEASFVHQGVKVRIDVLERLDDGTWALNEVKSSASYKPAAHALDVAVQVWVARGAGIDVSRARLVHLNRGYFWPGGPYDLEELFIEQDVTQDADARQGLVADAVSEFLAVLKRDEAPEVPAGTDCSKPYDCPFVGVCPASAGPAGGRAADAGITEDMRRVDPGCSEWIRSLDYPLYHLDFETLFVALPLAVGTCPYQQVPVQYSLHVEHADGRTEHRQFLASADSPDPRLDMIRSMVADVGTSGTILQWSSFEASRIRELMADPRYAAYSDALRGVLTRLRDLAEPVRRFVHDPLFAGSWSIKVVHPVLTHGKEVGDGPRGQGRVDYKDLGGVADGGAATLALAEYFDGDTDDSRRHMIGRQLLEYCELDTWAMVEVLRALRAECGIHPA